MEKLNLKGKNDKRMYGDSILSTEFHSLLYYNAYSIQPFSSFILYKIDLYKKFAELIDFFFILFKSQAIEYVETRILVFE